MPSILDSHVIISFSRICHNHDWLMLLTFGLNDHFGSFHIPSRKGKRFVEGMGKLSFPGSSLIVFVLSFIFWNVTLCIVESEMFDLLKGFKCKIGFSSA